MNPKSRALSEIRRYTKAKGYMKFTAKQVGSDTKLSCKTRLRKARAADKGRLLKVFMQALDMDAVEVIAHLALIDGGAFSDKEESAGEEKDKEEKENGRHEVEDA